MLTKPTTHYEALEISTDASPHEVREAYLRLKNAYNKDSVALYTLVSTDEREDILARVEEAYQILSDPERRKDYDRCHEQMGGGFNDPWAIGGAPANPPIRPAAGAASGMSEIVSIDRIPPMESSDLGDAMLIPPRTDAHEAPAATAGAGPTRSFGLQDAGTSMGRPLSSPPVGASASMSASPSPNPSSMSSYSQSAPPQSEAASSPTDRAIVAMIDLESDWRGESLRKMREARIVSMEELSSSTKISKNYLTAIETEEYAKLPAAVFTRGFLIQICRILKLPQDKVVPAYMALFNAARDSN